MLMSGQLIRPTIAVLLILAAAHGALAGEVLDRVRRDSVVRCTARERPAVAVPRPDGGIDGLAVDLCRAVAIAALGRGGRVAVSIDTPAENADVAFVEAEDGTARGRLVSGAPVFVDRLAVLVPETSRVRTPRDLAGETVCLMIGSPEQSALEAAVRRMGIDIVRLAFEEDVEMHDAYAVGRCGAMVGDWTELSGLRGPMGINRLASRLLLEPLALVPIIAATDPADCDWAAIVAWVVHAAVRDSAVASHGNANETVLTAPPAGIRPGWRRDAGAVLDGYQAGLRRSGGIHTPDGASNQPRQGD